MAPDSEDAESLAPDTARLSAEPQETDWTTAPLQELIAHLTDEHHAYFRRALPNIKILMETAVANHGHDDGVLRPLARVFESIRLEMLIHMEKEELLLFPAIERYEQAIESGRTVTGSPFSDFGGTVKVIEHEHESAGAVVRLIRDFTRSYGTPTNDCESYQELINALEDFEIHLYRHMNLENNVLFARAAALNSPNSARVKKTDPLSGTETF